MPAGGEQIPAWLSARAAGSRRGRGGARAWGARVAGGLVLLLAGGIAGYVVRDAREAPPPAPVAALPPPACPVTEPCAPAGARPHAAPAGPRGKPHKPAVAALVPLPAAGPDDADARKAALRRFANERGGELRSCVAGGNGDTGDGGADGSSNDRGRSIAYRVGAAIETDIAGGVDEVRIIGAEPPDPRLRRCYADRIRSWTFPRDLVRGREKILVTFAF